MVLKPKQFEMSNPAYSTNGNVCIVPIAISSEFFNFIESLPYVLTTTRLGNDNIHVWFDLRYNVEDAWLDLYEQLTIETSKVVLSDVWNIELDDLPPETP